MMTTRVPIEPELAAQVLYDSDRTCCVCRRNRLPVQLHHIDDDPSHNEHSNLAVLCTVCHNDTQLRGGFDRKLNAHLVAKYKLGWEATVAAKRVLPDAQVFEPSQAVAPETTSKEDDEPRYERIAFGTLRDQFGQFTITEHDSVFFEERIESSFPGLRGLRIVDDQKDALYRLGRLLRPPLRFDVAMGHGRFADPIWWWRGPSCLPIESFRIVDDEYALMDGDELKVRRIAAYHADVHYRCFVYIECAAMDPTGLYPDKPEWRSWQMKHKGYASEEYAVFNNILLTREYHDDGYAEKDGEVIDVHGSELRTRYLTPYNLIIAPKSSPLNSDTADRETQKLLDGILQGTYSVNHLVDYVERLPKSRLSY